MDQAPEQLRTDIARTRANMSDTIDAIEDHVSPSRIVERRRNQFSNAVTSMRDRVMGTVSTATGGAQEAAGSAAERASQLPHSVTESAQGSPLGAGLVAFGLGFVAAAVFPATSRERELTSQLASQTQPIADELKSEAENIAHRLEEPAKDGVDQVRAAASTAVEDVKTQAADAADETRRQATGENETGASEERTEARPPA